MYRSIINLPLLFSKIFALITDENGLSRLYISVETRLEHGVFVCDYLQTKDVAQRIRNMQELQLQAQR